MSFRYRASSVSGLDLSQRRSALDNNSLPLIWARRIRKPSEWCEELVALRRDERVVGLFNLPFDSRVQQQQILEVMKRLASVTEGTPHVETFDVANLTIHEIAAARAA
jgi:hypothetical protein